MKIKIIGILLFALLLFCMQNNRFIKHSLSPDDIWNKLQLQSIANVTKNQNKEGKLKIITEDKKKVNLSFATYSPSDSFFQMVIFDPIGREISNLKILDTLFTLAVTQPFDTIYAGTLTDSIFNSVLGFRIPPKLLKCIISNRIFLPASKYDSIKTVNDTTCFFLTDTTNDKWQINISDESFISLVKISIEKKVKIEWNLSPDFYIKSLKITLNEFEWYIEFE